MRTLAVTYAGILGGAERTLLDFAGALQGDVALGCPNGPLADRARRQGLVVFPLPARGLELHNGQTARFHAIGGLSEHARDVRRLTEALRPDLLLAWGMRSSIAGAGARLGMRSPPALLVRHVDFLPGTLVARVVRAAAGRADRVCVNSGAVGRDLDPTGHLHGRLSIIHPGVDLDAYDPRWDVSEEPQALFLGALEPWKRPDLALEAAALAARRLPKLRLTVAGAPIGTAGKRLARALRLRAAQPDLAGRVQFVGEIGDPREALGAAWCLLHCADREPFGNVLIQALASGRPVVAPDAGGPAEIVDACCGRLYPPGDAEAAADALVEVLSSAERARSLGTAGRAHAERFDQANAGQRFAELAVDAVGAHEAAPRRGRRPASTPAADVVTGAGLTLVTVSHNSSSVLPRLLRSAGRHLPGARLIVVDSGSRDDSVEVARAADTVLELRENAGFGRASNAGVALVEDPICALVNPDVEFIDDSLAGLATELLGPQAPDRILAPRVLSPEGSRQDTAHPDPGSPALLLKAIVPAAILPPLSLRRWVEPWRSPNPCAVGWGVGCCLVARTATLRRLGPFDARIFLFGEDMDLGLRAAEQGVETWFRPDARVLHTDAHSTRPAFGGEPFDLLARQRRAVIGERRGPQAARRDHWTSMLTSVDRIVLKTVTGRPTARERRQLSAEWRARNAPTALSAS